MCEGEIGIEDIEEEEEDKDMMMGHADFQREGRGMKGNSWNSAIIPSLMASLSLCALSMPTPPSLSLPLPLLCLCLVLLLE